MRDFRNLKEVDIRLLLLKGSDMKVENLVIKPYKLGEITEYGYSNYMQNIQWTSISIDDFIASTADENKASILKKQKDKLKAFDFYYKLGGEHVLMMLLESLKMIFRTDDVLVLDLEKGVIAIDFMKKGIASKGDKGNIIVNEEVLDSLSEDEITIVHRDNFDDLVEVVKLQNYLASPNKDKSPNPVDERTRQLIEQMEINRKKVAEKKKAQQASSGEDNDIDISDIVSAISGKSSSINRLNIWDLTLYQLYDEYSRLEIIDNYNFSLKAMMAGAENVELNHWSSKIQS